MRPADIDRNQDPWRYTPTQHKTAWKGKDRSIFIGPRAQEILLPYLLRDADGCCFQPAESEQKRLAELHAQRKTPLSCGNRPGTNRKVNPSRPPGRQYNHVSYAKAIARAAQRANVPSWHPNQLRHARGSAIRQLYGLEGAQVTLGHSNARITEVYAERDHALAAKIAREVG
jgi:integrase